MSIFPSIRPQSAWTVTLDGTEYELRGLSSEQFERFVSEYIEYGISAGDFEAFAMRWLEPDAGESLYTNGQKAYPVGGME